MSNLLSSSCIKIIKCSYCRPTDYNISIYPNAIVTCVCKIQPFAKYDIFIKCVENKLNAPETIRRISPIAIFDT